MLDTFSFFYKIFAFILCISFLVTIHELGHFFVARFFKVHIEAFSIGFGKPIIEWVGKTGTKYRVSWILLGGYVKMLGEEREQEDNNKENPIRYLDDNNKNNKSDGKFSSLYPYQRFLIAFAGPAINIIFAVLAFTLLFMVGIKGFKPQVGYIGKNGLANSAEIKKGDIFKSIDNHSVKTMSDARLHLISSLGKNVNIEVIRKNSEFKTSIDLSNFRAGDELDLQSKIGFTWTPEAIIKDNTSLTINTVSKDSPADKANITTGDTILTANNIKMASWDEFTKIIKDNLNKDINLLIDRDGKNINLKIKPKPHPNDKNIGYAGVSAISDSNAIKEGFKNLVITEKYNIVEALNKSITKTVDFAVINLKMIGRLITGKASIKNLSGPVTIANFSGKALESSFNDYIHFIAIISLALAIMNLLPIPALDGGHMLFCIIEMIKRKPLTEKTQNILTNIGARFLIAFMIFVIIFDTWRNF